MKKVWSKHDVDQALKAELGRDWTKDVPQFEHDCSGCVFLGTFLNETYWNPGRYDLYVCPARPDSRIGPTIIARFGVDGEYASRSLSHNPEYNAIGPLLRVVIARGIKSGKLPKGTRFNGFSGVGGLEHEDGRWVRVVLGSQ